MIRQRLREVAGVDPSSHWWDDCQTALRASNEHESVEAILQQILHHDLRDVVRTMNDDSSATPASSSSCAAVTLRQYVQQSLQQDEKVLVPATWGPLLLQVEETVDVSQNAEARLQYGPTEAHNPTPVGHQLHRCLKIAAVDGYFGSGQRRPLNVVAAAAASNSATSSPVARGEMYSLMEVSPIPQLSVHSRAGLKMVVRGPLVIRRGLILLHGSSSNSKHNNSTIPPTRLTVLGGQVERLVHMQRTALQQASLVAGVGMDPTVRALIGNSPPQEEDDDDDHGTYNACIGTDSSKSLSRRFVLCRGRTRKRRRGRGSSSTFATRVFRGGDGSSDTESFSTIVTASTRVLRHDHRLPSPGPPVAEISRTFPTTRVVVHRSTPARS
jgi:hypothetical protein